MSLPALFDIPQTLIIGVILFFVTRHYERKRNQDAANRKAVLSAIAGMIFYAALKTAINMGYI